MSSCGGGAAAGSENSSFFFGWDLLYKTVERTVNKKEDIIMALVHFVLVKHCNFRCLGLGDDQVAVSSETGSELLPVGWNDDDSKYTMSYKFNDQVYVLFAHKTLNCLIINLLDVKTKEVSNISLEPDVLVSERHGAIREMIPCAAHVASRIRRELTAPVFTGNTREITTQTGINNGNNNTSNSHSHVQTGPWHPVAGYGPTPWPENIGHGDLDPLGRGGPGSIMPFPSAPDFRNEVRPRFDPYGAPEVNIPGDPDPDELPPPGYGGHNYYT